MADLIDQTEVLALIGAASPEELHGDIQKHWYPRPVSEWEVDGLKPDGRIRWRYRPRWSRLAVMQAALALRMRRLATAQPGEQ